MPKRDQPNPVPLPVDPVENHNSSQWLRVEYLEEGSPHPSYRRRGGRGIAGGWYVVRTCPCHAGVPVTVPYKTKARAERSLRLLIDIEEGPAEDDQ